MLLAWGEHEEPGIDMFSGLFGGFDKGKTKADLRLGGAALHRMCSLVTRSDASFI